MGDKWELAWLMNNALEKYNKRKEEMKKALDKHNPCRGCIVKNTSCPDEFYELCLRCLEYEKEKKEMKNNTHEELVRQIREAGESLIKNAESIAGSEKYVSGLTIRVDFSKDFNPVIRVSKDFVPERYLERVSEE